MSYPVPPPDGGIHPRRTASPTPASRGLSATDQVKSLGTVWHMLLPSVVIQGVATVLGIVGGIMGIVAGAPN